MDMKNSFTLIVLLYLILYVFISYMKPNIMFDNELNITRPFGVGYSNTTILPLWLCSILLAIFSYFIIIYVLHIKYNNVFIQ
ncbi:hypothetical protein 162322332 [Organic Lake phycodnavirus 1]|nr:hypothetical protein 162322332 [Organic Lake phycodnavirus 1]